MRVPLVLAFAGLSATLVFAQQPTPTGTNAPTVTQIPPASPTAQPPTAQSPGTVPTVQMPAPQDQDPAGTPSAGPTSGPAPEVTADNGKKSNGKAAKPGKKGNVDEAKEDSIPNPGEELDPHIKKGSEDDVNAVGTAQHRRPRNWQLVLDELGDRHRQAVLDGDREELAPGDRSGGGGVRQPHRAEHREELGLQRCRSRSRFWTRMRSTRWRCRAGSSM